MPFSTCSLLPKYVMEHIGLFIQIRVAQNYKTRNFPRFPFDSRLTITVYRAGERLRYWGRAANISQSGIAATVSTELSLGETVTVQFSVGSDNIEVRASVRYKRGHFCGFEFLVVDEETRATIRRTCEQIRLSGDLENGR
jgi:c-di-GMP-binding flagellar brake protein YcgR